MNTNQNEIINKSYDWVVNVITTQKRFLSIDDFYTAYPFKSNGLTKQGLEILINEIKKVVTI